VDQVVERVLLGEEVLQLRIARAARAMQEADVAARAEGAEGSFLARAADGHGQHLLVLLPGQQDGQQIAHHAQRQRIQRLGPVQGDHAHAAPHFAEDFAGSSRHILLLVAMHALPRQPGAMSRHHS
jgi:hypothetical protein